MGEPRSTKAARAARAAKAISLSLRHHTYDQIVEISQREGWELPYRAKSTVSDDVKRAMEDYARQARDEAGIRVQRRLAELGELARLCWGIINKDHILVAQGMVVRDEHDEPLLDDKPKLEAVDRLHKITMEILKITGDYAPVKKQVEVGGSGDAAGRLEDVMQLLGFGPRLGDHRDAAAAGADASGTQAALGVGPADVQNAG